LVSRPLSTASQNALNNKVALIETDYPYNYSTNLGTLPNPMNWAQEGMALAQTTSYVGITRSSTPTTSYLNTAMATTEQRMAQGGHRLADLLNTLFPPIILTSLTHTKNDFSFSWNTVSNNTEKVQWKQQLTDPAWNDLINITATNGAVSFKEKFSQTQRIYRVSQQNAVANGNAVEVKSRRPVPRSPNPKLKSENWRGVHSFGLGLQSFHSMSRTGRTLRRHGVILRKG
jgi:S1/P1 Nuclease